MAAVITIPLDSEEASLVSAGGKGASLARLASAGFPVPPGFIITTTGYHQFVMANQLSALISRSLFRVVEEDTDKIQAPSETIRQAFSSADMPTAIESAIRAAYRPMNGAPVAVRSSATLEDLPNLSFAGQQDTFLNVIGEEMLLRAVVDCWSSLWTARAITYRMRSVEQDSELSLAIVVQEMVQSEVSGVMFTVNPLTGLLSEYVVDATFGLGEALVSGQVEPDQFVINLLTGEIREVKLGRKQVVTRSVRTGGVESVSEDTSQRQTLEESDLRQLMELGRQVQGAYGSPQDIEWSFAGGRLYLLQSRPVTSLFPVPEVSFDPLQVWFSFGAAQGVLGPITPLGREAFKQLALGGASMFVAEADQDTVRFVAPAGERIWLRMSDLLRHPVGLRVSRKLAPFIEPSMSRVIDSLIDDPRLAAGKGRLRPRTVWRVSRFFMPVMGRALHAIARPEHAQAEFERNIETSLDELTLPKGADRFESLSNIIRFMHDQLPGPFRYLFPRFIPLFGPSVLSLGLLTRFAGDKPELALQVTRALPNNVTTEMDLGLWNIAAAILSDDDSAAHFNSENAMTLANEYLEKALPEIAQTSITSFMDRYGMRGIAEIDLGQPRWQEDPTPVMQTLKSYLAIDPARSPDVVFDSGAEAARSAISTLAGESRRRPLGWARARLVRFAARRVRSLMGVRESPKFFAIRVMGILRQALLETGKEFADAETISRPDDLFFLEISELESLARREQQDWNAIIRSRRASFDRELRRKQVPRVLVSDGRAFYEGVRGRSDDENTIVGSPVSPGVVEGRVRVMLDPRTAGLESGEILVCPGTDPAWTPLFLAAGGLITEVGGMMTHGSVVAREYGIPAVVGVDQATTRLKTGQQIRLDGTVGTISLINS